MYVIHCYLLVFFFYTNVLYLPANETEQAAMYRDIRFAA